VPGRGARGGLRGAEDNRKKRLKLAEALRERGLNESKLAREIIARSLGSEQRPAGNGFSAAPSSLPT